jgi:hypothetical protein
VAPDNPYCRDYSAVATLNGQEQPIVGRSCELADGSWQVTQGTPDQPTRVNIVYPPPPPRHAYYPYYPGYDPFWGPPFVGVGASFIFVGGHHHHHGHGGGHGGHGHRG